MNANISVLLTHHYDADIVLQGNDMSLNEFNQAMVEFGANNFSPDERVYETLRCERLTLNGEDVCDAEFLNSLTVQQWLNVAVDLISESVKTLADVKGSINSYAQSAKVYNQEFAVF